MFASFIDASPSITTPSTGMISPFRNTTISSLFTSLISIIDSISLINTAHRLGAKATKSSIALVVFF